MFALLSGQTGSPTAIRSYLRLDATVSATSSCRPGTLLPALQAMTIGASLPPRSSARAESSAARLHELGPASEVHSGGRARRRKFPRLCQGFCKRSRMAGLSSVLKEHVLLVKQLVSFRPWPQTSACPELLNCF